MKVWITVLTLIGTLFISTPTLAYTVKSGDTLSEIATDHHLTLNELAELNPQIDNLNLIFAGQAIHTLETTATEPITPDAPFPAIYFEDPTYIPLKFSINTQETEEEAEKPEPIHQYTDAELNLLARLVRAEAQGESIEGKIAVACVVLNRVESPQYPKKIRDVIYQRRQFQPVANGAINKPADEDSIKAVKAALSDSRHLVGNSLFFYNPKIATSRWLDTRPTTVVIGNHVFKK